MAVKRAFFVEALSPRTRIVTAIVVAPIFTATYASECSAFAEATHEMLEELIAGRSPLRLTTFLATYAP
jgi:hypothetical protein